MTISPSSWRPAPRSAAFAPIRLHWQRQRAARHSTGPALTALKRLLRPGGHLMVRDLVAKIHQSHSTPYQIARTLKRIPSYMRRYDVRTALRLLKFELHPAWLRHRSRGLRLTPDTFEMTYGAHFPDGAHRPLRLDIGPLLASAANLRQHRES